MTESPAATLRRAAEKARTLANAATPGPWRTHDTYVPAGGYTATVLTGEGNDVKPVAWMPSFSNEPNDIGKQACPDAAYVAAMHPGVGLLIADQWDAVADDMGDEWAETRVGDIGVLAFGRLFAPRPVWTAAVTAARAFLGEEATS